MAKQMLINIFGPRTTFTDWFRRFLHIIITEATGDAGWIEANSLEDFKELWSNRTSETNICYSDAPDDTFVRLALRLENSIIISDHPYDVIGFIVNETNLNLSEAIRQEVNALCNLHDLFVQPRVLLLLRGQLPERADLFISLIANQFNLSISPEQIVAILQSIDEDIDRVDNTNLEELFKKKNPGARDNFNYFQGFGERNRRHIEAAFSGYMCLLDREPIINLRWAPEIFNSHDVPEGAQKIEIDLTGRARHLIFGPYFSLPSGQWKAHIHFAVDDIKSGCTLMADVVAGEIVAAGEVENVPLRGIFGLTLEFPIVDPNKRVEVRIMMKYGSIEGFFMFGGVEIQRLPG